MTIVIHTIPFDWGAAVFWFIVGMAFLLVWSVVGGIVLTIADYVREWRLQREWRRPPDRRLMEEGRRAAEEGRRAAEEAAEWRRPSSDPRSGNDPTSPRRMDR